MNCTVVTVDIARNIEKNIKISTRFALRTVRTAQYVRDCEFEFQNQAIATSETQRFVHAKLTNSRRSFKIDFIDTFR